MEATISNTNIILLIVSFTALLLLAQMKNIKIIRHAFSKKWNRNYHEATARVLSVFPTGKYLKFKLQVSIQLQVMPPAGRNFVVELKTLVTMNDLSRLENGGKVTVRYDPENVKSISIIRDAAA